MAENLGLLNGLKICENRRYEPLQVIGDSAMIIRQQKNRKPPKAKHLRNYYWRSRRLADKLNVVNWHHHLRDYNKMADSLVNLAMDTKRCRQVFITDDTSQKKLTRWSNVLNYLTGDLAHWQSRMRNTLQDGIFATPT
ncbi:Ribonuclease H-like domain [Phytophthora cactorum]|nr:Ribonuclease H-like domain [Phytophthora cactorum]